MVLILRFTVDSMFGDMCVSVKYSGALVYVVLILRLYSCWIEICSIGMCKKKKVCPANVLNVCCIRLHLISAVH